MQSINRKAELTTRSQGAGEQRKLFSRRKAEDLGVGLHNEKIVWESGLDG